MAERRWNEVRTLSDATRSALARIVARHTATHVARVAEIARSTLMDAMRGGRVTPFTDPRRTPRDRALRGGRHGSRGLVAVMAAVDRREVLWRTSGKSSTESRTAECDALREITGTLRREDEERWATARLEQHQ